MVTTETVESLTKVVLFRDLKKEELEVLAAQLQPLTLPARRTVIKDDDPVDGLYFIKSGTVKVVKAGGKGPGYEAVLGILKQGDSFGEIGLIDGLPRSATVIAMSPLECYFLSRDDFTAALEKYPKIAVSLFPAPGHHGPQRQPVDRPTAVDSF